MKKMLVIALLGVTVLAAKAQVADSALRHVVLKGAANFRDLGGYTTANGLHVKWGKVYRSADMSQLTEADLAELKKRNIAFDVDFRGTAESAQAPDKLNPGTDYILCPAGSDNMGAWMKALIKAKPAQGDSLMIDFYSKTEFLAARYKPFFEKLLAVSDKQSLVFHCSAGKDRTGIGAALFLYALGVPYQTITDDYLASNYYRKDINQQSINAMVGFMHIDKDVATAMLSVKQTYLDATFNAIKQQYGSVDNFLATQLGLNAAKIKQLKAMYLQK